MGIWDSKCVWDIIQLQDTIGFQDIYRKRDGKWLLYSMSIWDSKCDQDIIWVQDSIDFRIFIRKRMVNDYQIVCVFGIVSTFGI